MAGWYSKVSGFLESPLGSFLLGTVIIGTVGYLTSERKTCLATSQPDLRRYINVSYAVFDGGRAYLDQLSRAINLKEMQDLHSRKLNTAYDAPDFFGSTREKASLGEFVAERDFLARRWITSDHINPQYVTTRDLYRQVTDLAAEVGALQPSLVNLEERMSGIRKKAKVAFEDSVDAFSGGEGNGASGKFGEYKFISEWESCSNVVRLFLQQYGILEFR